MNKRALILFVVLASVAVVFAFGLQNHLRLSAVKESHATLVEAYRAEPVVFVAGFMAIHVCALALCLPCAVLTMALAAGSLFGPALGTVIVLTSLTVGDSLGFLAARFLIGDWVRARLSPHLRRMEREVDRNGAYYLLSLRLMAAVPYFVVNLTFGVTQIRLRTFAPISFVGLAPATALYVAAGTELPEIESPRDILSGPLLVTCAALAVLPLIARYLLGRRAAA